jgi:peptidoglycan hydrolase-like protein with peptidoglycan-binding domain
MGANLRRRQTAGQRPISRLYLLRFATILALGSLFLHGAVAATTKPSAPKKSPAHAAAKKAPATSAKRRKTVGAKTKTAASWRSRQLAPTPERYKEIQSALAQRGYLKKDANGVWDSDSADAMRRFQQDQNLEPSGKLNSLSLIALGMGAKHNNGPATPVAPTPPTTAPAPPDVQ